MKQDKIKQVGEIYQRIYKQNGRTIIRYYQVTPAGQGDIQVRKDIYDQYIREKEMAKYEALQEQNFRNKPIINTRGKLTTYGKAFLANLPALAKQGKIALSQIGEIKKDIATRYKYDPIPGKKYTALQIVTLSAQASVEKILANTGMRIEDLAAETGINVNVLKDPNNWTKKNGGVFTEPETGKQWYLIYNYHGNTYMRPVED